MLGEQEGSLCWHTIVLARMSVQIDVESDLAWQHEQQRRSQSTTCLYLTFPLESLHHPLHHSRQRSLPSPPLAHLKMVDGRMNQPRRLHVPPIEVVTCRRRQLRNETRKRGGEERRGEGRRGEDCCAGKRRRRRGRKDRTNPRVPS
eukprot:761523-Hanusia_phi.AAC.1